MLSFDDLERMATYYIRRFIGNSYVNRDTVDYMISELLPSVVTHDMSKGASLSSYLFKKGRWRAYNISRRFYTNKKKLKTISLNDLLDSGDWYDSSISMEEQELSNQTVDFLLNSKFLNDMDRDILHMIYVERKKPKDCALKHKIIVDEVYKRQKLALKLMKKIYKSRLTLEKMMAQNN